MPFEYNDGLDALQELIRSEQEFGASGRNEATTRLQVIDRLFFDCLGWPRQDCVAEEHHEGQFADYCLMVKGRALIVEAKREGQYFELPIGTTRRIYKLRYFNQFDDVKKAIGQAMGYCQSRGTRFGAVSNGQQLIAFVASRTDGLAPEDGECLVFDSLEQMEKDFLLVWQCLSREGIASHGLSARLSEGGTLSIPEKPSASIQGYPGFQRRNSLQTDLQILADVFLQDIVGLTNEPQSEADFLKSCYCQSGALSQYANISRDILRTRYSVLFEREAQSPHLDPVTTKRGLNPEMLAEALSRRPILLMGDRGVGKTMFIKHLYKVDEDKVFRDSLVLYVDYGSSPAFEADLARFTATEVERQLLADHSVDIQASSFVTRVLARDIQRFDAGIVGELKTSNPELYATKRTEHLLKLMEDKDAYLGRSLEYITASQRKQVVIFLDNVDQRPDAFQEQVFLIGTSMSANWPCTVFVSIRPDTFYKSKQSGTLSA